MICLIVITTFFSFKIFPAVYNSIPALLLDLLYSHPARSRLIASVPESSVDDSFSRDRFLAKANEGGRNHKNKEGCIH